MLANKISIYLSIFGFQVSLIPVFRVSMSLEPKSVYLLSHW